MRIAPFTFCGFHRSLTKIIRREMPDVNRKNFINTIGVRSFPFFASNSSEKACSSWKVVEANKGLGEAPKSCTRKEHENATNSIAKRGQGAIAPCRVKGQRPLWGLGQRPNCSASDQSQGSRQQRRRQRSVPASNFARPQTRPQAALPPRFRDEPQLLGVAITKKPCRIHDRAFLCLDYALPAQPSTSTILWATIAFTAARAGFRY